MEDNKSRGNTLVIGAGSVSIATIAKCAQYNNILGNIILASRTLSKCDSIISNIKERGFIKDDKFFIKSAQVDATSSQDVIKLINKEHVDLVINVTAPNCNMSILDACIETGVAYIDTAIQEDFDIDYDTYDFPWYAHYEWKRKDICRHKGITAILGCGFDPGVVNAYCAYALKHYFSSIETIDIMDVNAGDHGEYFATNFDPETNLVEIEEYAGYFEDDTWKKCKPHSINRTFDFPEIGQHKVYLMGHDEIHSLPLNIRANNIRFWMGFSDHYINCFNVLNNIGFLSVEKIKTDDGTEVVPIKVLKALLPPPSSLAENYVGKTCIGNLIEGTDKKGENLELFIYNICDHKSCYEEVGSQAIGYTAGIPPVAAAVLVRKGVWNVAKMVNVEELDPDPFLELLSEMGLSYHIEEY
jgi:saccharopine dehydrogenase-like NADP-dependent oxidoreductase